MAHFKLVKNYGLSWSATSSADLILRRMAKTDIAGWLKEVRKIPNVGLFAEFVAVTGLRLREAASRWAELGEEDARLEGFSSAEELKEALRECYGNISDETEVFIYRFKLLKNA